MTQYALEVKELYGTGPDGLHLDDINLRLKKEEVITILGDENSGKSTLLNVIGGFYEMTHGRIEVEGIVIDDLVPERRLLATVFEGYNLWPHMNVANNLTFGLKLRRMDDDIIDMKLNEIIRILKIEELVEKYPSELSGREKQTVAIGRALLCEPKVLLMNEPFGNLNKRDRLAMVLELKRLQQALDLTIIYATNNREEALFLGHRVVLMKEGKLETMRKVRDLFEACKATTAQDKVGETLLQQVTL